MFFFKHAILIFSIISQHTLLASEIEVPQFEMPDQVESNSGHIKVTWASVNAENVIYVLEVSPSKDFQTSQQIYEGPDLASFISGLANGTYYYRIRAVDKSNNTVSAWSDPVQLTVEHHSIHLAFTLAGIGTFVFLLTAFVVIRGANMQEQSNEF